MADASKESRDTTSKKVVESGEKVKEKVNKGKALAKAPKKVEEKASSSSMVKSAEDKILNLLEVMKSSFDKQMKDQNEKIQELASKVENYEQLYDDYENFDDDEESFDDRSSERQDSDEQKKRKSDEDENNNNRFKDMAKRFKSTETCDVNVDSVLASTGNELFLNGLDEEHYNKLTKDDLNARPENCDALTVVKMNQLIWDAVSPNARTSDRKLQHIEESIVKSGTVLVKAVN
ncbi:origin recognition complex subunit 5-like [Mercenaria mercenaria]|uniref:origin recognition complex subunit 5-like n=1 Tax=Mercenaria mercenaria TaxID=6596 RepID=UPI00234F43DC|nr:origin recognition complex subunit 5-like [Mercenaria mercenaria]